jgi:predicted metal-dependent enzyme (double-stranded beta helix superfamily)
VSVLDHTRALPTLSSPTPAGLARLALTLAADADRWRPLLHVDPVNRWYARLARTDDWEAWLLTWAPGQRTGVHDHGGSAGAFTVLEGQVEERTPRGRPGGLAARTWTAGEVRAFGGAHVHEVVGTGDRPAATLHVYGPRLSRMNRYELDPAGALLLVGSESAGEDW